MHAEPADQGHLRARAGKSAAGGQRASGHAARGHGRHRCALSRTRVRVPRDRPQVRNGLLPRVPRRAGGQHRRGHRARACRGQGLRGGGAVGVVADADWVLEAFVDRLYGDGRVTAKPVAVLSITYFLRRADSGTAAAGLVEDIRTPGAVRSRPARARMSARSTARSARSWRNSRATSRRCRCLPGKRASPTPGGLRRPGRIQNNGGHPAPRSAAGDAVSPVSRSASRIHPPPMFL